MSSSVRIRSSVAVILEMRADLERLVGPFYSSKGLTLLSRLQSYSTVSINNLGSRITEDLILCTILITSRNFILHLILRFHSFLYSSWPRMVESPEFVDWIVLLE